ncbi:hypothetical protein [Kitasatospora aureofaciens]
MLRNRFAKATAVVALALAGLLPVLCTAQAAPAGTHSSAAATPLGNTIWE